VKSCSSAGVVDEGVAEEEEEEELTGSCQGRNGKQKVCKEDTRRKRTYRNAAFNLLSFHL
jgi:hypothetical protein